MKITLVILIALGVACARPQKRSDAIAAALDIGSDDAKLKEYLKGKTAGDVRNDINTVNGDINKVLEFLGEAQKADLFVMKDGEFDVTDDAEEIGEEMEKFFKKLELDTQRLPPFPKEGEAVFINKCKERAMAYDFNQASDVAELADTFMDQVFECAIDGVTILEEISDISDVDDKDLTFENLKEAMKLVERVVDELGHLIAFVERKFQKGEQAYNNGGIGDYNDFIKSDKRTLLDVLNKRRMEKLRSYLN